MPCGHIVTVFLGDRRCAPAAALPLVCRRRGCHSRRDSTYRRLKLRWINHLVVWLGWPVYTSNAYKQANRVTHVTTLLFHRKRIFSCSHILRRRSIHCRPKAALHVANQPPFGVNHDTRRSKFERPIPVSVLWQL